MPQPRTYPSAYSLCCGCLMSLSGFDPPPPTLKLSVRSHYATMTRLICASKRKRLLSASDFFPSHISVANFIATHIIGLFRSTVF